jgi:hypothetical protein
MTQALAVFLRRCCLVPIIERRLTNAEVQVIEVPAHDLAPRLDDDRVGDPHKRGSQPSYHLNRRGETPDSERGKPVEAVAASNERESPAMTKHLMEVICAPENIAAAVRAVVRKQGRGGSGRDDRQRPPGGSCCALAGSPVLTNFIKG